MIFKVRYLKVTICAIFAGLATFQCTTQVAGGGGSEVPNGVTGQVVSSAHLPLAGREVAAYPGAYPFSNGQIFRDTTDSMGNFQIELDTGWYHLIVRDLGLHEGIFVSWIEGDSSLGAITLDTLGTIELSPGSSMDGRIAQIAGTPFRKDVWNGSAILENVPPGKYTIWFYRIWVSCGPDNCVSTPPEVEGTALTIVQSGDTVYVDSTTIVSR